MRAVRSKAAHPAPLHARDAHEPNFSLASGSGSWTKIRAAEALARAYATFFSRESYWVEPVPWLAARSKTV